MSIFTSIYIKSLSQESFQNYWRKKGAVIGEQCEIRNNVNFGSEPYLIKIGNHVRINSGVHLVTHDGGMWVLRSPKAGYGDMFAEADVFGKITICDNVHIGTDAIIMPNVTIGQNVIVGCGAVVTHDVLPNTIVGGVPARVIESLDEYAKKTEQRFVKTKNMLPTEKKEYLQKYGIRGQEW